MPAPLSSLPGYRRVGRDEFEVDARTPDVVIQDHLPAYCRILDRRYNRDPESVTIRIEVPPPVSRRIEPSRTSYTEGLNGTRRALAVEMDDTRWGGETFSTRPYASVHRRDDVSPWPNDPWPYDPGAIREHRGGQPVYGIGGLIGHTQVYRDAQAAGIVPSLSFSDEPVVREPVVREDDASLRGRLMLRAQAEVDTATDEHLDSVGSFFGVVRGVAGSGVPITLPGKIDRFEVTVSCEPVRTCWQRLLDED